MNQILFSFWANTINDNYYYLDLFSSETTTNKYNKHINIYLYLITFKLDNILHSKDNYFDPIIITIITGILIYK